MQRQLTTHSRRSRTALIGLSALAGACAALVLPGATSPVSAGAALLAVGALAFLAGHGWGLTVSVPSHVAVAGHVWPNLAYHGQATPFNTAADAVVLITALPALALAVILLPRLAREVLGNRPARARAAFVAAGAAALVAALLLPAL